MTQERIDIEAYIQQFTAVDEIDETEQLKSAGLAAIAELKRCYEEIDQLRETAQLMVTYLRYMRDGELTDKDWLSVNELIGEEE